MKALTYSQAGGLNLVEVPNPTMVREDDVLLRIRATGVCGTDLHILSGGYDAKPGIILGHESTGEVIAVGRAVGNLCPGTRVVLDPTYHCGNCFYCATDRPNYCISKAQTETGVACNGTFAEYHVARSAFLYELPAELSFEVGTLTEPLACVLNALRFTRYRPDATVLVVGAGPIGLLFGLASTSMGLSVTVGEVAPYRLAAAAQFFERVYDVRDGGLGTCVSASPSGKYDIVIDTTGRMLGPLLQKVERGGEILLAGLDSRYEVAIQPGFLTDNGIRVIGSIDTNRTFSSAISLLRRIPDFAKILTHRFELVDYREAFNLLGLDLKSGCRAEARASKIVLAP